MPAFQVTRESTRVDENIVFKTAYSGNHPKQLQKRITQASLVKAPSTANFTNEHYSPKVTIMGQQYFGEKNSKYEHDFAFRPNPTTPHGYEICFLETRRQNSRSISSGISKVYIAEYYQNFSAAGGSKIQKKLFIFPIRITKEATKELKSPIFSANATLPITVSEMAPIKERIEHYESLFAVSQEPITDSDDTTNSRISFVDVSTVKSIEKGAFICSDDED